MKKLSDSADELAERMNKIGELQVKSQTSQQSGIRGRPSYDATDAKAAEEFRAFADSVEINRRSDIPFWVQLKNQLERKISDGSLAENARLPSELAMSEMFKLSRPVVRNALSALVSEGLIVKQPRKGIFVSSRSRDFDFMTSATGVFDDLSAKGMEVQERTYEFGLFDADADEQQALRLPNGFQVVRFVRVYIADGSPITHSRISLPANRVPGLQSFDMTNKSIFGTIREHFGLSVARADRWINARSADKVVAERLNVSEGYPLIHIQSIAYDHEKLPLEFYRAYYNAEVSPIHISAEANR